MKIVLAADGSEHTRVAARKLAGMLKWFAERPEVHVLHVRPPFPFPHAGAVAGKKAIDDYEREEALKALAPAEDELKRAGVAFESTYRLGDVASEIVAFAEARKADLIFMGAHGYGALQGVALGSITTKVIALTKTPVLIAR
jgi:nucleotide-binding universal stress UspA family protein